MTIKLNNLTKWAELTSGMALMLRGSGPTVRKVRLQVNTEVATAFYALEHGAEYFLGVANGLETFEFTAEGEVEVSATPSVEDGAVWYWTDDGDLHAYEHAEGFRLFVKPMSTEERSPAMDAMAAKLQARHDKRMAQQQEHNAALWAQLAKERAEHEAALAAAQKPVDDNSGAAGGGGGGTGAGSGTGAGAGEGAAGA